MAKHIEQTPTRPPTATNPDNQADLENELMAARRRLADQQARHRRQLAGVGAVFVVLALILLLAL